MTHTQCKDSMLVWWDPIEMNVIKNFIEAHKGLQGMNLQGKSWTSHA